MTKLKLIPVLISIALLSACGVEHEVTTVNKTVNTLKEEPAKDNGAIAVTRKILNIKTDEDHVLYLDTEVSFETMEPLIEKLKKLEGSKTPIYLLINSPGGSVVDGAMLISQMEAMKTPVNTICTRLCASMAAMIHSYGTHRYALDRSILMYHPASMGVQGQLDNIISRSKMLKRYLTKMELNVQTRSGMSKARYDELIAYEYWVDADDAATNHLVDNIVSINVPLVKEAAGLFSNSDRIPGFILKEDPIKLDLITR